MLKPKMLKPKPKKTGYFLEVINYNSAREERTVILFNQTRK
jgi:hypothetical protein